VERILLSVACTTALAALGAACASSGAVPRPFPIPGGPPTRAVGVAPAIDALPPEPGGTLAGAYALVTTALQLRGTPYRDGGTDPFGFDCSGFTQYVFSQHQLLLPREAREQYEAGRGISLSELAPGDLLFFSTTEPGPSHVAIALGTDEFVHAPSSNGVVRVERLSTSYWSQRFIGARRIAEP
jgi:hypothetical protein